MSDSRFPMSDSRYPMSDSRYPMSDSRNQASDSRWPALVLVAHGSRDPAAHACLSGLAAAVGAALPGVAVRLGYADVRAPTVADALGGLALGDAAAGLPVAVVVPAFLATGYHVRCDVPAQLAACGAGGARFRVTPALGPDPRLVAAARDRLVAAGWAPGDPVVLAAAGSSDPAATGEVRVAARLLGAVVGRRVRVGFAAAAPRVEALVAGLHAAGERVAVASWLLAPGVFQQRLAGSGAAVVGEPLGTHPGVVAAVVARYRAAVGAVAA